MSLLDIEPTPTRGVIRIGGDCDHCEKPVPVLGLPGKGRPLETFGRDYFCTGHALMVEGCTKCRDRDVQRKDLAGNVRCNACAELVTAGTRPPGVHDGAQVGDIIGTPYGWAKVTRRVPSEVHDGITLLTTRGWITP